MVSHAGMHWLEKEINSRELNKQKKSSTKGLAYSMRS